MKPVRVAIVGAGGRGSGYAGFALEHPDRMQVVAVAEPREFYRQGLAEKHAIPAACVFHDWRDLAAQGRLADVVIVATQDAMHAEPAIAFAGQGYHLLLEKPMAPNEEDCRRIVQAAVEAGILFAVCHVLRYTVYTRRLKALIDGGALGEVVSIQHLEPVGYWHQAHSFVRGNWRNERQSSPMLLAKSCHDLDWIRHIMGARCLSVASFGSLKHFRRAEKPAGAGMRCTACDIEGQCAYSAKKLYLGAMQAGRTGWPVDVVAPAPTVESVTEAIEQGPYGRCVYECDNDVVDHQVVGMQFEGRKAADFMMTAFHPGGHRQTHVGGTQGYVFGDGEKLTHHDFRTDRREVIDTAAGDASILGGHGGGDYGLMTAFIAAVAEGDAKRILSGPEETLETHRMVFAAERSRREHRVVDL